VRCLFALSLWSDRWVAAALDDAAAALSAASEAASQRVVDAVASRCADSLAVRSDLCPLIAHH
jgi:hypothetical protein